jgi:hypothetical protein
VPKTRNQFYNKLTMPIVMMQPVWSKNSNVPFSQYIRPHYRSLFILHSTAR